MQQLLKKRLKDQKGFTLIELLAVIVILGILAAIAIPSVLGIIDNSKKDAHVANAQQVISATKMSIASNNTLQNGTFYLTLSYLETNNYLDSVSSPDSLPYLKGTSTLIGDGTTVPSDPGATISCVKIVNGKITMIRLTEGAAPGRGISRSIADTDLDTAHATEVTPKDLSRSNVQ